MFARSDSTRSVDSEGPVVFGSCTRKNLNSYLISAGVTALSAGLWCGLYFGGVVVVGGPVTTACSAVAALQVVTGLIRGSGSWGVEDNYLDGFILFDLGTRKLTREVVVGCITPFRQRSMSESEHSTVNPLHNNSDYGSTGVAPAP